MYNADCFHQFGLVNFTFSKLLFYKSTSFILKMVLLPKNINRKFAFRIAFSWMRFSNLDCVKSIQIRSYFWPVFSCIWTEYGDLLRLRRFIQSEYRKIRTRNNSVFGHFSHSIRDLDLEILRLQIRGGRQISVLRELTNFYSSWNHQ